jgi:hypothetical protein
MMHECLLTIRLIFRFAFFNEEYKQESLVEQLSHYPLNYRPLHIASSDVHLRQQPWCKKFYTNPVLKPAMILLIFTSEPSEYGTFQGVAHKLLKLSLLKLSLRLKHLIMRESLMHTSLN